MSKSFILASVLLAAALALGYIAGQVGLSSVSAQTNRLVPRTYGSLNSGSSNLLYFEAADGTSASTMLTKAQLS